MLRTHFNRCPPLQTREICSSCHTDVRCVPSGGKSWGTLWLQPLAVIVCWIAAPFAQTGLWEGVSLFVWTGVNSALLWFCFSVTPVLVNPILLLTDIFLNATVTVRTKGERSEMFLEAGCKGQVNGYSCANTDSDPYGAARVVESIAIICSHSTGWHSTETTWRSAVSSLCLISH